MKEKSTPRKAPAAWVALVIILLGLILFMTAAAGGLPIDDPPLRLIDNRWKLALSAAGLLLMAIGILMLTGERERIQAKPTILDPDNDLNLHINMDQPHRFQRYLQVYGGYSKKPPEGSLRLFTVTEAGRFWPQTIAKVDAMNGRWHGEVDLGPGPYYSIYVVVALVDLPAIALWNYYFKVGDLTGWEAIDGPFSSFAIECDRFLVEGLL